MTLIEKPYLDHELNDAVPVAFKVNAKTQESHLGQSNVRQCIDSLTPREDHLMDLVIAGVPNKRIAGILGISQRTVDRVRARVFEKMGVESAVELARVVAKFGRPPRAEEKIYFLDGIAAAAKDKPADCVENGNHLTKRLLDLWLRHQQSIAYEIGDGLARYLTEAARNLEHYYFLREEKVENAGIAFDKALELLKRGINEVRLLIRGLQPAVIEESGIASALEHLIGEYRTEAEIDFRHEVPRKQFDPLLESTIYRIIHKTLSDACRRGRTRKISLRLVQHEDLLCIDVVIRSADSDAEKLCMSQFALEEIRGWAELLGGRISIDSMPDGSSRISIELPAK